MNPMPTSLCTSFETASRYDKFGLSFKLKIGIQYIDINLGIPELEDKKENITDHKCNYCLKYFSTADYLKDHISKGVHNHKCKICGRILIGRSSTLRYHVQCVHEGIKE